MQKRSTNHLTQLSLASIYETFTNLLCLIFMLSSFQHLVRFFGLKPKAEEKEVTGGLFFMLWFEFCADFKARWKRENKILSKDRYQFGLPTGPGCSKSSSASGGRRPLCRGGLDTILRLTSLHVRTNESNDLFIYFFLAD